MAGSVNKVILVGNLGRDPEVRYNPDGGKIVSFSIATSEVWKDKASGERRDRTEGPPGCDSHLQVPLALGQQG